MIMHYYAMLHCMHCNAAMLQLVVVIVVVVVVVVVTFCNKTLTLTKQQ